MNSAQINYEHLLTKYRKHESDTGSTECQIIRLTKAINGLSASHIPNNHKDKPAIRSLVRWVAERNRHKRYMEKVYKYDAKKLDSYLALLSELGLRR